MVALDDRAAHGQADPHAIQFGGEERLEELICVARIETHAAVTNGHTHEAVVVEAWS